jgi:hypothetical protein
MTSSPEGATAPGEAAARASEPPPGDDITPVAPVAEAVRAMEEMHRLLEEAIALLQRGGPGDTQRANDLAAGCADHVARALWFLHRAERADEDGAGQATG